MPYTPTYTLVEHEGQPGVVVSAIILSWELEQRVRDAGGLVWATAKEAGKTSMEILEFHLANMDYDQRVALLERCFSNDIDVGGRRLYVPTPPPTT
jgi:hypothetical protein